MSSGGSHSQWKEHMFRAELGSNSDSHICKTLDKSHSMPQFLLFVFGVAM